MHCEDFDGDYRLGNPGSLVGFSRRRATYLGAVVLPSPTTSSRSLFPNGKHGNIGCAGGERAGSVRKAYHEPDALGEAHKRNASRA